MNGNDLINLELFVASPGDVHKERQAVQTVLGEISRTLGPILRLNIHPFLWENDLGPGAHVDGPQGLVDAHSNLAKCDIFNLGGSQTVTLNEMIASIEKAVGKKARINELPEQPGDVPLTSADVSKAARLLNFKPTTHIDTGIPRFVEWWMEMRKLGLR